MKVHVKMVCVFGIILCLSAVSALATGMDLIAVSNDEITIHLNPAVTGTVHLLEVEPYDTLNPLRDLEELKPDAQQLDLTNEGFLRMTFLNDPGGFDPQIQFPENRVNADYVGQFSMRARVSGTAGGADMPIRIFGAPDFTDITLPADGAWHIVRASVTNWSGMRTLRIDPANGQTYASNTTSVLDIDWAAVTYRDDFSGDRNHTGLDVFIDLGVPSNSWSGAVQPTITLPRYDGLRDRLYTKYVLTSGGTNQIGSPRFVTDLTGISYVKDTTDGWAALNTANGMMPLVVSNGLLIAKYNSPVGVWDPAIQASSSQRVDMDVAKEFAFKYRITGYTGGLPTIPLRVFGFVEGQPGNAWHDDTVIPDGAWHVKRIRLDASGGTFNWHGNVRIRLDTPNGSPGIYPAAHFSSAVWEVDWLAVSDDPLFTPAVPIVDGGRVWTFWEDRTFPLQTGGGFKGIDGNTHFQDKADLGTRQNKLNFLLKSAVDLSVSPSATLQVDEFEVGLNESFVHTTLGDKVRFVTTNGMATTITSLNGLEDYWLDEGSPVNQRFNPLRNYLTATNPPASFSVAHNVMDPVGIAYYRGILEYMGWYFTDPTGVNGELYRFTIGNELDQHWSWYNVGDNVELEEIVEIYLTACRIADLALRSQHPDYRIYLSFTHFWNMRGGLQGPGRSSHMRDFLDLFAARAREEGDFPWGLNIHPYPVNLRDQEFWNDTQPTDSIDSTFVTFKNLQVARRYLQKEHMLYNGQTRLITLGEQGFDVTEANNPAKEAVQASALAYSYKITEQVPGIEAYLYHRHVDNASENNLFFGIWEDDFGTSGEQLVRKRPSWNVMRDYGTIKEAATFAPFLTNLPISAWSEINLADIELRYEFNEPNPDITTTKLPVFDITNGVFSGTVTTNDPQIINENVNTYGDGHETMLIRLKTERSGDWELFWRRAGDGAFSGARKESIPVVASDEFQIYQLDLSANTDWVGENIIAWRLDPVPVGLSDYDFEIDYLLFGSKDDFDGDGISDATETLTDTDGDGLPDLADTDSNGNGYADSREVLLGWSSSSVDTDGDGIDNDWEILYGFNPHDALEAAWDLDDDGYDTLAEHIADTDPTNVLSYFIISGLADGTNVFVDGKAERTYTLMATSNLVSGGWNAVDSKGPIPADMAVSLVDTNVNNIGIYRVNVEK